MTTTHFSEVLSEQDLVSSWQSMLRTSNAVHVEIDFDELCFGLVDATLIHYVQSDLPHPLHLTLQDMGMTKWQWYRLRDRVLQRRREQKMLH